MFGDDAIPFGSGTLQYLIGTFIFRSGNLQYWVEIFLFLCGRVCCNRGVGRGKGRAGRDVGEGEGAGSAAHPSTLISNPVDGAFFYRQGIHFFFPLPEKLDKNHN